jgi:nucleoside-triphosphatase
MNQFDPDLLNQPASALARIADASLYAPQLIIVTGESGTGKTTRCARLIEDARQRGLTVNGLLSPAVLVDGQKIGIDLVDLASGEQRRLATLRDQIDPAALTRRWRFDDSVVEWGNRVLYALTPANVLVIDELGPLEFVGEGGFQAGLAILDMSRFDLACVVVRPSLIPDACLRWPSAHVMCVDCED